MLVGEADELRRLLVGSEAEEIDEGSARRIAERLARCWGASLLLSRGDQTVAGAYLGSRLGGDHGSHLGTLGPGVDVGAIAKRTVPTL